MDDDFNTPEAIAVLFELARDINRCREEDTDRANRLAGCMLRLGDVLGLVQSDPEDYLKGHQVIYTETAEMTLTTHQATVTVTMSDEKIEQMIEERLKAREQKNWGEADRIRDELAGHGIVLEDGAGGTTWRRG